jgi:hypothetical protein
MTTGGHISFNEGWARLTGEPQIASDKKNVRPLGSLQEIDNLLFFHVIR